MFRPQFHRVGPIWPVLGCSCIILAYHDRCRAVFITLAHFGDFWALFGLLWPTLATFGLYLDYFGPFWAFLGCSRDSNRVARIQASGARRLNYATSCVWGKGPGGSTGCMGRRQCTLFFAPGGGGVTSAFRFARTAAKSVPLSSLGRFQHPDDALGTGVKPVRALILVSVSTFVH